MSMGLCPKPWCTPKKLQFPYTNNGYQFGWLLGTTVAPPELHMAPWLFDSSGPVLQRGHLQGLGRDRQTQGRVVFFGGESWV